MTGEPKGVESGSRGSPRWFRSASLLAMALMLSAVIVDAPERTLAWVLLGIAFLLMLILAVGAHRAYTGAAGSNRSVPKKKGSKGQ